MKVVRSMGKSGSNVCETDVIEPVKSVVRVENVGGDKNIENDESAESVERAMRMNVMNELCNE